MDSSQFDPRPFNNGIKGVPVTHNFFHSLSERQHLNKYKYTNMTEARLLLT